MAHIVPPAHLQSYERFTALALGMEVGQDSYQIKRTGRRVVFTYWARWRGRFIIDRLRPVERYDNMEPMEQDVQTWLDALKLEENTTEVPIAEPTIVLPEQSWVPTVDNVVIADGFLTMDITEGAGRVATKNMGDMVGIGTPERLYKFWGHTGITWMFTPDIMPQSVVVTPRPVDKMKCRVLTQTSQTRRKSGRGGWDVEYEEVIE